MSEYQYVAFRAIDAPVTGTNLEFMRRQSTRADVTPWAFDNEYNYGGFRGNAAEMLRRGYDFHLAYANYGTRILVIRLPHGFPDDAAVRLYLAERSLEFHQDKAGPGGILVVEPGHEPGDLQDIWNCKELVDRLIPLRAEILEGDLRPLYLAHLAVQCDMDHDPESSVEGPVPTGLQKLTPAQSALAEFYGLGDALIKAAAEGAPAVARADPKHTVAERADWLKQVSQSKKDAWLAQWMADPHSAARSDMLAAFRNERPPSVWPTVRLDRTIAQLQAAAVEIERETARKAAARAAREKSERLARMAADPEPILQETEELVKQRDTESYGRVAALLAELRESLAGGPRASLAEDQARKLNKKNPTLSRLTSALRHQGFLKK